jgi:hypothetical protein
MVGIASGAGDKQERRQAQQAVAVRGLAGRSALTWRSAFPPVTRYLPLQVRFLEHTDQLALLLLARKAEP